MKTDNCTIDFDKLTHKQAQNILNMINDIFTIYANCNGVHGWNEATSLQLLQNLED